MRRAFPLVASLLLLVSVVQAAPLTLAWDCARPPCAAYGVYYDIGCTGHWVLWTRVTTPEAFVLTSPGVTTCWRVTAIDAEGQESVPGNMLHVTTSLSSDAAGKSVGYCVQTK